MLIIIFYCTSYRLNMFLALPCPSSGAHDYNMVIDIIVVSSWWWAW